MRRVFSPLLSLGIALLPVLAQAAEVEGRLADDQRAALSRTIRGVLIESLPRQIEDADDWGAQKEVPSGLKFETVDGKPKLSKRTKPVNHGLWRQIAVEPVEPEKNLRFEIVEARTLGPQRVAFELVAAAPLRGTARVERWRFGVKLLNFATEADAEVELRLTGEVNYRTEWRGDVNQLIMQPTIRTVDLKLVEFDLQKLGILDGKLAEELGDLATPALGRQLDKQEARMVEKINQTLAARQDKLVLDVDWSWLARGLTDYLKKLAPSVPGE
ncbi:MAG: hypothetical protein JNM18_22905 [Planctomycetaceae bacterium]|nr:hypothetical protein [Planctomycetaceae bacterium]